jgi:hypothetical protein
VRGNSQLQGSTGKRYEETWIKKKRKYIKNVILKAK